MSEHRASLKRLYLRATAASQAALGFLFFTSEIPGGGVWRFLAYMTVIPLVAAPLMVLFTFDRYERHDWAFGLLFASVTAQLLSLLSGFFIGGHDWRQLIVAMAYLGYLAAHWVVARVPEINPRAANDL